MSLADFLKKKEFPTPATATTATTATFQAKSRANVADVANVAVANLKKVAANDDPAPDPDRHCYPHTEAMNGSELALMTRRLATFARLGLSVDEAERMADKLMQRDRDPQDDRHTCMECQHCQHGRCSNSPSAWLQHPVLAQDYALELKRCSGFAPGQGTLAFGIVPSKPLQRPQYVHPLTTEQKVAAQQYHQHHAQCQQCQSGGRGYSSRCSAGAALWNQYQEGIAS